MVGFILGEIQRRLKYGFSILLPAEESVPIFGERIKLSHIEMVL